MRWKHWTVLLISACLNNFAEKKMAWLSCERWIWPSGAGRRGAGGRANRGSTGWPRSRFMAHHCLTNMGWLAGRWRPLRERPLSQMAKANISDHQPQAFGRLGCK